MYSSESLKPEGKPTFIIANYFAGTNIRQNNSFGATIYSIGFGSKIFFGNIAEFNF
jgi:hypothetical protein